MKNLLLGIQDLKHWRFLKEKYAAAIGDEGAGEINSMLITWLIWNVT